MVIAATPFVRLPRDLLGRPVRQIVGRIRRLRPVGEHFDVGIELRSRVGIGNVGREEDTRLHGLELDAHAELFPARLDDVLLTLAQRVDGRLIHEAHLDAGLFTNAVRATRPASFVEQLIRLGDVELADVHVGGVLRSDRVRRGHDVAGRLTRRAIQLFRDRLAVDGHRQCLTHLQVGQERVLRGRLGARAIGFGVRVGKVDQEALDVRADCRCELAAPALHQLIQDLRLDLQVPRVVGLTRLEDGTRGLSRVAAALDLDLFEERLGRVAEVRVDLVGDDVAGLELLDLVRTGAVGRQVAGRVLRLGAHVVLELRLLDDVVQRTDKELVRVGVRLFPSHHDRRRVGSLDLLDAFGDLAVRGGSGWVGDVLVREHHVGGGEVAAVGPFEPWLELPGDGPEVARHTAVVDGRDLCGQQGDWFAVRSHRRERLEHQTRGVVVLGALGEVAVQDGRRLPVDDPQQVALAASASGWLGGGCRRGRGGCGSGGCRCGGRGRSRWRRRCRRGRWCGRRRGGRWWRRGGGAASCEQQQGRRRNDRNSTPHERDPSQGWQGAAAKVLSARSLNSVATCLPMSRRAAARGTPHCLCRSFNCQRTVGCQRTNCMRSALCDAPD